jgi:large subunit ribosomal protein L25
MIKKEHQMENRSLAVQVRTDKGKEAARKLRHQGLVPAVVYGHREEPIHITLNPQELSRVLKGGAGERALINLTIEGSSQGPITKTVILKDKQLDPLKRTLVHADLYAIAMDEEIHVNVPIHIIGKAVGAAKGGLIEHILREIEIKCFPADIPPRIEVDVTSLDIGDSIHVADISLEKAKIMTDVGQTIVTLVPPAKEEVVAVAEVAEVVEEGEKKEGEGEEGEEDKKKEEKKKEEKESK